MRELSDPAHRRTDFFDAAGIREITRVNEHVAVRHRDSSVPIVGVGETDNTHRVRPVASSDPLGPAPASTILPASGRVRGCGLAALVDSRGI